MLPIPDPRTWPAEIKDWFCGAVGEWTPTDVFIFDQGQVASLYLHDAITAAAILEIDVSEWHTERGYPAFFFDPQRIGEIQHRLGLYGYTVHVLEPSQQENQFRKRKRASVVSIASAREKQRAETK